MPLQPITSSEKSYDPRDRLILALYAQLKAERETREAMEWVMRNGGLSPVVLEAMASDPVPVVTNDDLQAIGKSPRRIRSKFENKGVRQ